MFNFLCKIFILHHGKHSVRSSPTDKLLFLQNPPSILLPLFKFVSTDSNQDSVKVSDANEDSFTVSYLMKTCGFSRKYALSASNYLHLKAPDKPDSVLAFLKENGFSKTQIRYLVQRFPPVLTSDHERTLLPKVQFFQSKGMDKLDISRILTNCPSLMHRSLENHLIPSFNYICDLLESTEGAIAAIKRAPVILCRSVETYMAPYVNVLRDSDVPVSKILLFLRYWPDFRITSLDQLRELVERVKEMGISPSKSQFVLAIVALRAMSKTQWERKIELYKKWGLSEEEIMAAFGKFPWFLIASEDKIMAVMDFFVNTMGWESSVMAKRPVLITLSLKKRMIPRAAVIQFLLSKGLIKNKPSNLIIYLEYTEELFIQRFLNTFDEAPELLKLYKQKLGTHS